MVDGLLPMLMVLLVAALFVRAWMKSILPVVARLDEHDPRAALWCDAMLPVLFALPFLGLALRTGRADLAASGGWLLVAAPVLIGGVSGGLALTMSTAAQNRFAPRADAPQRALFTALAWLAAGLALLLLSAIGSLSLLVGQTLLAIGAVLLWVIAPGEAASSDRSARPRSGSTSTSTSSGTIALLFALAIALAALIAILPAPWHVAAVTVHAGSAIILLTATLRSGAWGGAGGGSGSGNSLTLRIAGWTAVHGSLLGLGTLSLITLISRRTALIGSLADPIAQSEYLFNRVAGHAHLFAMPAVIILFLAIGRAAGTSEALPRPLRIILAIALAVLSLLTFASLILATDAFSPSILTG